MIQEKQGLNISEDWWAVIAAFFIILLATIGVLGEQGIMIKF
jgi:hypothetical protein